MNEASPKISRVNLLETRLLNPVQTFTVKIFTIFRRTQNYAGYQNTTFTSSIGISGSKIWLCNFLLLSHLKQVVYKVVRVVEYLMFLTFNCSLSRCSSRCPPMSCMVNVSRYSPRPIAFNQSHTSTTLQNWIIRPEEEKK